MNGKEITKSEEPVTVNIYPDNYWLEFQVEGIVSKDGITNKNNQQKDFAYLVNNNNCNLLIKCQPSNDDIIKIISGNNKIVEIKLKWLN